MTSAAIITRIQAARARNNANWMDLLRLAMRVAPEEARAIFARIAATDFEVVVLTKQLVER